MRKVMFYNTASFLLVILILSLLSITAGCGSTHQDRVNTVSRGMVIYNAAWSEITNTVTEQARTSGLSADLVSKHRTAGELHIKLNKAWKLVPQVDVAIENFLLSPDFLSAMQLSMELGGIVQANPFLLDELKKLNELLEEIRKEREN